MSVQALPSLPSQPSSVQLNQAQTIQSRHCLLCLHSPALFSSVTHELCQSQHCIPNSAFTAQLCSAQSHTNYSVRALPSLPSQPSCVQQSQAQTMSVWALHSYLCLHSPGSRSSNFYFLFPPAVKATTPRRHAAWSLLIGRF